MKKGCRSLEPFSQPLLLESGASKGGMKVGGVIPKEDSLYKGALILPTFIPPSEAPDRVPGSMHLQPRCTDCRAALDPEASINRDPEPQKSYSLYKTQENIKHPIFIVVLGGYR